MSQAPLSEIEPFDYERAVSELRQPGETPAACALRLARSLRLPFEGHDGRSLKINARLANGYEKFAKDLQGNPTNG